MAIAPLRHHRDPCNRHKKHHVRFTVPSSPRRYCSLPPRHAAPRHSRNIDTIDIGYESVDFYGCPCFMHQQKQKQSAWEPHFHHNGAHVIEVGKYIITYIVAAKKKNKFLLPSFSGPHSRPSRRCSLEVRRTPNAIVRLRETCFMKGDSLESRKKRYMRSLASSICQGLLLNTVRGTQTKGKNCVTSARLMGTHKKVWDILVRRQGFKKIDFISFPLGFVDL